MSSLFGIAGNGASEFYTEKINQSVRFNDDDSPQLYKTFGTPTSNQKMIYATWFKTTETASHQSFFSGGSNSNNYMLFALSTASFYSNSDMIFFGINTSNVGRLRLFGSTSTGPFFRDSTNWYHILLAIDTTQATNTDRIQIFVNGKKITTWGSTIYPSQDYSVPLLNTAIQHNFGFNKQSTNYGSFDGYFAETYFLDGQSIFSDTSGTINSTFLADADTLSMFCTQKNGVAIPKTYSGTFGNNGVKLTYADSSALGDDTSGNGNDFTSSGLTSTDVVLDSPTNNFCTINSMRESLVYNGSVTFSEGNLQSVDAGTTYSLHWTGTFGMSTGKWYWEVLAHTMGGSHANIGICNALHRVSTAGTGVFYGNDGKRNPVTYFTGQTTYGDSYTSGDIIGIAFDADNETVTFYKNNSSQGAVGSVLVQSSGPYFAAAGDGQNATTYKYVINFGQDSSFAGNKTAQGNKDGNGNGDFYYTPPSGYLALCSANLPDTELSPDQLEQADDYFVVTTYSGDSNNNTQVSTGFQPDWVWIKNRNEGSSAGSGEHMVYDTNRGVQKDINTNDNGVEATNANGLQEFGATFFRPGSLTRTNETGDTYVSWNWRINGGTTSTDNNGSLTSTVQTNSKVGISIATFNVPTQANFSFGHGLGSVPEMFWWKSRTNTQNWIVYHPAKTTSVPGRPGLYLNNNLAGFTTGGNWITELSSTRIAITDGQVSSGSNRDNVVYSFKSVEGFSKIGSYAGNGSTDGTFVYTGFRPAFILVKSYSHGEPWNLVDTKRDTFNVMGNYLQPNSSGAEGTIAFVDSLSNGFKLRSSGSGFNGSGYSFIYMAFAEQPFKFSNAR